MLKVPFPGLIIPEGCCCWSWGWLKPIGLNDCCCLFAWKLNWGADWLELIGGVDIPNPNDWGCWGCWGWKEVVGKGGWVDPIGGVEVAPNTKGCCDGWGCWLKPKVVGGGVWVCGGVKLWLKLFWRGFVMKVEGFGNDVAPKEGVGLRLDWLEFDPNAKGWLVWLEFDPNTKDCGCWGCWGWKDGIWGEFRGWDEDWNWNCGCVWVWSCGWSGVEFPKVGFSKLPPNWKFFGFSDSTGFCTAFCSD